MNENNSNIWNFLRFIFKHLVKTFFKVEVNIPEQPFFGEPAPIGDKCVITEREYNCHFDEGYCARRPSDSYGPRSPCQWVAPTTPCPQ